MKYRVLLSEFFAPFFAATTPLVSALSTLGADLLSTETVLIVGVIAVVSLALSLLAILDRRISVCISVAITLIFVDLGFGGNDIVSAFVFVDPGSSAVVIKAARIAAVIFISMVTSGLFWALRRHISTILASGFGAMLLSSIVMDLAFEGDKGILDAPQASPAPASSPDLTPASADPGDSMWVHFIFDELMGVGGLPQELEETRDLSNRIRSLFDSYGFRVYEKVYSRHYLTNFSVPDTLDFDYLRADMEPRVVLGALNAGKYFSWLRNKGYLISVFQADVLHYCPNSQVASCRTFSSFDPRSHYLPYSLLQRSVYLLYPAFKTFENSYVANYTVLLMGKARIPSRFDVQGFSAWFDDVADAVFAMKKGQAVFAHFMVPHAPYLLDSNCRQVRHGTTPYDLTDRYPSESAFAQARSELYADYAEQVECVMGKLDGLLAGLSDSGQLGRMTFIIHGDHGSRISRSRYVEKMEQRDYVDNYAAHFSIRAPGVEAGEDDRLVSIQRLFSEYTGNIREGAENGQEKESLQVQSESTREYESVAMPPF